MSKNKYDSSQTHMFTSFPESHQDIEDMEELLQDEEESGRISPITDADAPKEVQIYSLLQIEYYQKHFNVNTTEVLSKILGSIKPTFNQNYYQSQIKPNPDLYGPFWIAITLIFTIAISGNFVSFMQNFGSDFEWHTDFHKVTTSAFAIIIYWWIVPVALYSILRWRFKEEIEFTFIELLSIYGYSLFIYIPISILWMINIPAVQWILVLLGITLSGSVLFFTLWPALNKDSSKHIAIITVASVVLLNALLGLSFMLYFFHDPSSASTQLSTTTTTTESAENIVKEVARSVAKTLSNTTLSSSSSEEENTI